MLAARDKDSACALPSSFPYPQWFPVIVSADGLTPEQGVSVSLRHTRRRTEWRSLAAAGEDQLSPLWSAPSRRLAHTSCPPVRGFKLISANAFCISAVPYISWRNDWNHHERMDAWTDGWLVDMRYPHPWLCGGMIICAYYSQRRETICIKMMHNPLKRSPQKVFGWKLTVHSHYKK